MRTRLGRHVAQHAQPHRERCDCNNCPTVIPVRLWDGAGQRPAYVIPGPIDNPLAMPVRPEDLEYRPLTFGDTQEIDMRVRTPRRPEYVPADAVYVPMEFANEHPRRRVSPKVRAAIGVLIGFVIAFTLLAVAAHRMEQQPKTPGPVFVTPSPTPTPPGNGSPPASGQFTSMPVALDVIWTR